MEVTLFFDGGIRKGTMAFGFVAYSMDSYGGELFVGNGFCGKNGTSNISEYRALIAGLERCIKERVKVVHIIGDSQLIIQQVLGSMKTNKHELKEHKNYVLKILHKFDEWTMKWVPRDNNKRADALVNEVFEKRWPKCRMKCPNPKDGFQQ